MGAEKIGWIEKKVVSLTESFDIYMEGKGGFGPFKPPPAYEITGECDERKFIISFEYNTTLLISHLIIIIFYYSSFF